jgi:hypothetical protein
MLGGVQGSGTGGGGSGGQVHWALLYGLIIIFLTQQSSH